ncbi:MAG: nicotinamide-nucleotide amidohydrolase family protein, partial [Abditibacteriota bacterium]|nr:nicotinamide-nucleotide amidohydrolase family protein [Abditibacteriota bacterium]
GAVSEECAKAMAEGVRKVTGADIGVSTTGIAGPGGGTDAKPVGLVYIGLATDEGTAVMRNVFNGGRNDVRRRTVQKALDAVRRFLK